MRLRWTSLTLGMLFTVALAGCDRLPTSTALPEMKYHGTMSSSCAPTDAPSTELRLQADEGDVWVFFNLWPAKGVVPPVEVRFDANRSVGQGAYCTGPETCEPAEWGEVSLENSASTAAVSGDWTLGMPGGQVHRGGFVAEWLAIQALCG